MQSCGFFSFSLLGKVLFFLFSCFYLTIKIDQVGCPHNRYAKKVGGAN